MNLTTLERRMTTLAARLAPPARRYPRSRSLAAPASNRIRGKPMCSRVTRAQIILLCSRQSGQSQTTAILATHRAVTVPNSLVLLLAPALRQSQELFRQGEHAATRRSVPSCRPWSRTRSVAGASERLAHRLFARQRANGQRLFCAGSGHRRRKPRACRTSCIRRSGRCWP